MLVPCGSGSQLELLVVSAVVGEDNFFAYLTELAVSPPPPVIPLPLLTLFTSEGPDPLRTAMV